MLVRGRVVGTSYTVSFEILKDKKGVYLKVKLPDNPIEYSVDCPCLEPLELLGLFLPALEEEIGEVQGVFVEEVVGNGQTFLEKVKRLIRGDNE
ncbi:hypothetical protein A3L11_09590 [Thermococcus siculi]|uniref:Uncharacterized protein n=1 Tax=Thermococcus siculi TaxID=72803 RepID=A0A2Z2MNP8_9EURY|nr:hypothetical protein [Thermococcus siculi]ASJ09468.1 hypothetical protein A3L11_09590 [Thermococcus siculi]